MKAIYLDKDFMCHLENEEGRTQVETDVLDGVYDAAIPYYRFIPQGAEWTDSKGRVFHGLFIQAVDSAAVDRITQQLYIADMQNALALLGVTE